MTEEPKAADRARGRLARRIAAIADEIAPNLGLGARVIEQQELFDASASEYEWANPPEMYLSPARLAEILAGHVANRDAPILDVACGTGLSGQRLAELGYSNLTGIDLSAEMLALAEEKRLYQRLIRADLHAQLPLPEASFAAAFCAGGFYDETLAVQSLAQVLPLLKPGGVLVCDIEIESWDDGGFRPVLTRLEQEGILARVHAEVGRMFGPGYFEGPKDAPGVPHGVYLVAELAGG